MAPVRRFLAPGVGTGLFFSEISELQGGSPPCGCCTPACPPTSDRSSAGTPARQRCSIRTPRPPPTPPRARVVRFRPGVPVARGKRPARSASLSFGRRSGECYKRRLPHRYPVVDQHREQLPRWRLHRFPSAGRPIAPGLHRRVRNPPPRRLRRRDFVILASPEGGRGPRLSPRVPPPTQDGGRAAPSWPLTDLRRTDTPLVHSTYIAQEVEVTLISRVEHPLVEDQDEWLAPRVGLRRIDARPRSSSASPSLLPSPISSATPSDDPIADPSTPSSRPAILRCAPFRGCLVARSPRACAARLGDRPVRDALPRTGRRRPGRTVALRRRSGATAFARKTRLPTPAAPRTVTSWQELSAAASARRLSRSSEARLRPTRGESRRRASRGAGGASSEPVGRPPARPCPWARAARWLPSRRVTDQAVGPRR